MHRLIEIDELISKSKDETKRLKRELILKGRGEVKHLEDSKKVILSEILSIIKVGDVIHLNGDTELPKIKISKKTKNSIYHNVYVTSHKSYFKHNYELSYIKFLKLITEKSNYGKIITREHILKKLGC